MAIVCDECGRSDIMVSVGLRLAVEEWDWKAKARISVFRNRVGDFCSPCVKLVTDRFVDEYRSFINKQEG